MATIDKVKDSLRITVNNYDSELTDLINAAKLDLGIAGVENRQESDGLIIQAIKTYCKLNFGEVGDYGDPKTLQASYDEQKAQLRSSSRYNGRDNI